jgi:predicted methyltransferase
MARCSLIAVSMVAIGFSIAAAAQMPAPAITAAVADAERPAADKDRDADRKPAEVVAFAGIKAGDKVADLLPGGGYFTRIFAKVVGPKGKVYAVVPAAQAARPGALDRIKATIAGYPNVELITTEMASLALPEKLDVAWTSENYHDLHNAGQPAIDSFNRAVFAALKPGGIFYVEDHSAPGAGDTVTKTLHRIDPVLVKREVEAAGFKLAGESTLLANSADTHMIGSGDPAIRGKTDKFVLKFRKPK